MKKSTLSAASVLGTGLVLAGLTLAGAAAPAFAHTGVVSATCTALSINVTNYSTEPDNDTPNTITITIDGESDGPQAFGASYFAELPLDGTVAHSYSVYVDGVGTTYDKSYPGETVACVVTPTPTPTPTTPATPGEPDTTTPTPTPTPTPTMTPTPTPTPTTPAVPAVPETVTPAPTPTATTPAVAPVAEKRELASTGTQSTPLLAAGLLAVLSGAGVLLLVRRLRRTQH